MGPAALLDYPRNKLRGLVLEQGGASSHVAIVARAIGIPAVGDVANITDFVETGDAIILDGSTGDVQVRPGPDVEAAYAEKARLRARRQEQYVRLRDVPAVSKDGVQVRMHMNAGLIIDMQHFAETGAESVGLFRTELQFMVAATFPRAEQQERLYRDVLDAVRGKPVTFRTIDIGGDKVLPYFKNVAHEENPALGWRAIRLTLDRPGLLRTQLRALLRAAGGRELRLMLPMVTELGEIAQAREIIDKEVRHLSRFGHDLPTILKVGAMLEVPSLLFQLDELMQTVDFVSVGSNDLFQFVMATDRGNTQLSDRFDPLSVPFLRVLKQIADAGARSGTPVTLCGELAGKPISALALIGVGFRSISMSPAAIGPVKAMLVETPVAELKRFIDYNIEGPSAQLPMRALLHGFAQERGIPL